MGSDGADHGGHRGQEPGHHGGPGHWGNMRPDGGVYFGLASSNYC